MPTVTVCKGCGQSMMARNQATGKPSCVTCIGTTPDSGIPVEVDVPDAARCSCGQTATWNPEEKKWHIGSEVPRGREGYRNMDIAELPFYDSRNNSFYCGCRGWD